jgi:hypothetical protein
MPRSCASQFRAMVVERIRNGGRVADVAGGVEVSEATVVCWVRQDRPDRGEAPGTSSLESPELRAAVLRIAEPEAELATVRRGSEPSSERRAARPTERCPILEPLARRSHGAKRGCRVPGASSSTFCHSKHLPVTPRAIRRDSQSDVIPQGPLGSRSARRSDRITRESRAHAMGPPPAASAGRPGGPPGPSGSRTAGCRRRSA